MTLLVPKILTEYFSSIAISPNNLLYAIIPGDNKKHLNARLICLELHGLHQLWSKEIRSFYHHHAMKITGDGSIWINAGKTIDKYNDQGELVTSYQPELKEKEHIGAFVLASVGIYVCGIARQKPDQAGPPVMHIDYDGKLVWKTELPISRIPYAGLGKSLFRPGRKGELSLRGWRTDLVFEPMLLSGERLLVTGAEWSRGLGLSYCINKHNGKVVWATRPGTWSSKAIPAQGHFLIGSQGYDAFDTYLFNSDGRVIQHWKTHGDIVITEEGRIRLVEMENTLPSRMRFVELSKNGTIRRGPHLPDYYTSYPAIDQHGTTVFWRNNQLMTVDAAFQKRILYDDGANDRGHILNRTLLTNAGQVVLAGFKQLLVFDAGLGSLANSPWPCGHGNLGGNPVYE